MFVWYSFAPPVYTIVMRLIPFDIVVANHSSTRGIGYDGVVPWNVPDDSRRFCHRTQGHVLILGRRTWDSWMHHPLPDRFHVVITRRPHEFLLKNPPLGVAFVASFDHVLRYASILTNQIGPWFRKEAFVMGGQTVYEQAVTHPMRPWVFATEVQPTEDTAPECDCFFPYLRRRSFKLATCTELQHTGETWIEYKWHRP